MPDPSAYPRRHAVTRGFTLGAPRGFAVAAGGDRVAFLRSAGGDDPVNRLWVLDLDEGDERLVADPAALLGAGFEEALPAAERARRERARERSGGIVAFAADRDLTVATFALGGRLFAAGLAAGGGVRELAVRGPVLDPRPDPTGRRVAFVAGGALRVAGLAGADPDADPDADGDEDGERERPLAGGHERDDQEVGWGLAEFVAAEEMGRDRGFWWAPDGRRLAVARVDNGPVGTVWLHDPAAPQVPPARLRYPAAGTANADVRLFVADLDGGLVEVGWDRAAFPYLAQVVWRDGAPLTLLVQSRDQRALRVLAADPGSGDTAELARAADPAWLELVPGVPAFLDGGRLVLTADDPACDTRRLTVDGEPVTPPGLQVAEVVAAAGEEVLLAGSEEPTEVHLWRVVPGSAPHRLTADPGQHAAVAAAGTVVVSSAGLGHHGTRTTVRRAGRPPVTVRSLAEEPPLTPRVRLLRLGRRELRAVLLFFEGPHDRPLPVLLDPYGGPHHRRVLASRAGFLASQWFAEQGFAVLVADGRGTPGRGPAWERAVRGDLAGPALQDQVDALEAAAGHAELDLGRVAIRGWSFGGFLAACAVLRRPDVFHAAVAGAPVTDWRLYDTHYTERYLGRPGEDPGAYRRSSLLASPAEPRRPLLLVHGLADDNVLAAHTLRLSALLLAAGRPHGVLPLSGVTHLAAQEAVAENLLHLQLAFLRTALGLPEPVSRGGG
ncbi:MAG TPA: prolyl oligopeptidase family serine peptidase [Actinomycetes bacterium]|nr:prolyl oligopeptidase family serine peptidase [Actinomycetes bacterium]